MMHALMMHHDARVNARVDARVNAHAMQSAWMRMRCSLRECACDAACVDAHAMQFTCLLNQLNQLNHHCLIQMIIVGFK